MTHSYIRSSSPRAFASWLLGAALVFGLLASGDKSVWSAGAGNSGIDPLEILNLAVRANAIVVLDSSGSMGETASGVGGLADDDPDSKIGSAKIVLKNVISANQTKVSFSFGIYDQQATYTARFTDINGNGVHNVGEPLTTQVSQSTGNTRFQYTAKNATFPTTEPAVQLRLFEVPVGSNWTIAFANGVTNYTTAPLPARVYTGTELAQQMAALMNAQDASGYGGSFSDPAIPGAPVFTFTRSSGSLPFAMAFSLMNVTLRNFLRAAPASGSYLGDTNDVTSPYSIVPNVGTFTAFTIGPPNSFTIAGGPTIRIGRGGTNFTTTLTNATYSGANLAAHIATRMGVADNTTAPPDNFIISAAPNIRFKRGGTTFNIVLVNGTYTGATLASHIAARMSAIDSGLVGLFTASYTGAYNASTGVFSFNRIGADLTNSFQILYTGWGASLQGASAAAGGIRAPAADSAIDSLTPYTFSTLGGLTATTMYSGSYNTGTGVFTFTRSPAFATSFDIVWSSWTASLLTQIGAPGANASDATSPFSLSTTGLAPVANAGAVTTNTGPANSTAPLVLYRRSDSGTYDFTDGATASRYLSIFANKYFNGETLSVLANGTPCFLTAGVPAVSPAVPPITVQVVSSCGGAVTDTVIFLLRGASAVASSGTDCGGFKSLVGLAPCTDNDQFDKIATPYLDLELGMSGSSIIGYTENNGTGGSVTQPTQGSRNALGVLTPGGGIRAAQATPIAESLIDIRTVFTAGIGPQPATPFILPLPDVRAIWPVIAAQTQKQRTFVIFVTDGDDTCQDSTGAGLGLTGDQQALRAAHKAEQLHNRFVASEPESSVTTYLIAFGTGAAANRSNWIAWGGSGMSIPTTGAGAQQRWAAIPTAAQRAACTTCRDAFLATNAAALSSAIQSVIDQGQTSGEFSDQQSITETIYEYVDVAGTPAPSPPPAPAPSPYNALDPLTRYGTSIPVLLQSTFVLPDFSGHLKAFRNNAGASLEVWDAGRKLIDRVVNDPGAMTPLATYTFAELHGGATPATIRSSSARIKRRIFSTVGQGVLSSYTTANLLFANTSALAGDATVGDPARVDLWPPTTNSNGVAPSANNPAPVGSLDEAMGIGAALTTVAAVQALFPMACIASSDATPRNHPDCTSGTAGVPLARAKREAREQMLAYLAGAAVSNVSGLPDRTTTGDVLFVARPYIMAESTLAAPALVTPPILALPLTYRQPEYLLFRDGPRDSNGAAVNATKNGLGLRNPDFESPASLYSQDSVGDNNLKPQMSVVYHATNQGLHAFRAGPCPTTPVSGFPPLSLNCSGETGGEELWAFVPFDQLGKLPSLLKTQTRSQKTYLLAAPVRITDVFVSGSAPPLTIPASGNKKAKTVTAGGVWRTLAIFGRGIAGKNMTAIDVTVPGVFTTHSLDTSAPIVVWSRGNFDTRDGLVKSASNAYTHDAADYSAYLEMGETWSVPAIGFVKQALHVTPRRPAGVEFAMFMGSGYSDVPAEGKTFFVLDALSGDVIYHFALPDGTVTQAGLSLPNVLPASPAAYTVEGTSKLSPAGRDFLTNPVEAAAEQVYFGDLHSRIWRYSPGNPGVAPVVLSDLSSDLDQPLANGLALLAVVDPVGTLVPQVFTSSGRDSRVSLRTPPPRFRMYGYSDGTAATPAGPVTQLFARDFPLNYRGNSAPAAGFSGGDSDRNPLTPPDPIAPIVFFTGLSFAAGSDPLQPCVSRFDSVLFALQGLTGLAALDLNSTSNAESDDAYAVISGQVLQNPHITNEGTLVIDRGLGAQSAPPAPAPPDGQAQLPPLATSTTAVNLGLQPGTPAFMALSATTRNWRAGSAVCNVNP